jgi:leucyl aminopeptidase
MINVSQTQQPFWNNQADGYVIFIKDELTSLDGQNLLNDIEQKHYPHLKKIFTHHQFKGNCGQSFVLSAMDNDQLIHFIFVGVGKVNRSSTQEVEMLRRALAEAIRQQKKLTLKTLVASLPEFTAAPYDLAKQLTIAAHMASYECSKFKSDKKEAPFEGSLLFVTDEKTCAPAIADGNIIGQAINMARDWADTPGNILTPTELSLHAATLAQKHNLKHTIFGRDKAIELGMGAFLAVDAGSDQDGKFVVLEYKAQEKDAPTIALCGKGVTFDSGGISLKPSNSMTGMKFDMSGAAAVIAVMDIIAHLKPAVNVICAAPMVENMPSGKAARQDDVVTAMNGKTIEIKNTDAEGRLILADALCYVEKNYHPDIMIDIATLTGACAYALGHFYSAVITPDKELATTLEAIGAATGDRVWELPFDDDFKASNKSDIADVSNSGSPAYLAGTITAGCFLHNFVDKARWAHLDIAGTAHDVPAINYVGKGSTGAGIRLLTEFILAYKK